MPTGKLKFANLATGIARKKLDKWALQRNI